MSETEELADKLKAEGDKFIKFFKNLSEGQWETKVYAEGGMWTVRNVLSHFVTSERGLVKLFEQIRQGGAGAAEDFSIDRYNKSQQEKTQDLTAAELLEQYKAVRADSVHWVLSLTQEELELKGRHPFLGDTVVREMVKMLYLHNQLHYRDLKRVLK